MYYSCEERKEGLKSTLRSPEYKIYRIVAGNGVFVV